MSGNEEAQGVDIFIHLEGGREVRIKDRSASQCWSKSW